MSEVSSAPRARVLDAAKAVFARYGFRKASMEDIAREAGMSRPALYQWFGNKRAVFQALAGLVASEALSAADVAWPVTASLAEGLPAAILAKDLPLYKLLNASPHGAELMAVDEALASLFATKLETAFAALLTKKVQRLVKRERGPELAAFGGAVAFGSTVAQLAAGLKATAVTEDDYTNAVRRLCRVVDAAASLDAARIISVPRPADGTPTGNADRSSSSTAG